MISEENWLAEKLRPHIGHNLVCVRYGGADAPADICIECEDCREMLVSAEDCGEPEHNDPCMGCTGECGQTA